MGLIYTCVSKSTIPGPGLFHLGVILFLGCEYVVTHAAVAVEARSPGSDYFGPALVALDVSRSFLFAMVYESSVPLGARTLPVLIPPLYVSTGRVANSSATVIVDSSCGCP